MATFDWSKADVERAINKAVAAGRPAVTLVTTHNSSDNELDMIGWIEEMGYESNNLEMERIVVTLRKEHFE